MIVDFTPDARADLSSIGDWIGRDDPERASIFVDELIDRAKSVSHLPMGYPEVDAGRCPGIRRLNHRGYRIFYRVRDGRVEVLNIHHPARGAPDFLG